MKKWTVLLVFAALLMTLTLGSIASADNTTIAVFLDGKQLSFPVAPTIEEGTTLVPMRVIFETLGAKITWDGATKTVQAKKNDIEIILPIGSPVAYKNGQEQTLLKPAKIIDGSTLVPLRYVSEALGAWVGWEGTTKTILIYSPGTNLITTKVVQVVDGDTVKVEIDGKTETVRIIGIDTPETKHPTKGVEPWGPEASEFTKSKVEGKEVKLEYDIQSHDMYGRRLAYVYLSDGSMLNALLVKEGLARVATFPPNVKYVDLFTHLQAKARELKMGMWSTEPFNETEPSGPALSATTTGVAIVSIDLQAEIVIIKNGGTAEANLTGWKLVSIEGNQTFTFPAITLAPGATVKVTSGSKAQHNPPTELKWTGSYIWNNDEDPGELYDAAGNLVSKYP